MDFEAAEQNPAGRLAGGQLSVPAAGRPVSVALLQLTVDSCRCRPAGPHLVTYDILIYIALGCCFAI